MRRSDSVIAVNECISPSSSTSGSCSRSIPAASRIFSADGALEVPKFECASSATFGVTPKWRTSSMLFFVVSTTCSTVGSKVRKASARNSGPLGSSSAHSDETWTASLLLLPSTPRMVRR